MSAQKLVIFDLDGTLIDTEILMVESVVAAFNKIDHAAPDEKSIRAISGLGLVKGFAKIAPRLEDREMDRLKKYYQEIYLQSASASMRESLFGGALAALKTLAVRKDLLISVATGKSGSGTDRVLRAHNILPLFTSVHTPDTNRSKPDPDMVHSAMGIASSELQSTLMIGDTVHDINMAVAAGVKSIGVNWGYHTSDELIKAGADVLVDDFSQMLAEIDNLVGGDNA